MAAVRVLEQYSVAPPAGSVPETSLPLTFFDVLWLYGGPVERIFFYPSPNSTAHFVEHLLPILKSSLSLTLRHFFPLAGHVRPSPGSDRQFELHYADGDSVQLTLAECDADFDHLSGDHARDLAELRPLVPLLPGSSYDETRPLLALQLTVFPNNGVSIGIAVHHVACDGAASMHFMKSWAAACRSSSPPPLPHPVLDRSLISDPKGLYSIWLDDIWRSKGHRTESIDEGDPQPEPALLSTITLRPEHIEALKRRVTANKPPFHCSAFVVACAFVWVSLVRARREFYGDRTVHFSCAVDCRARLHAPLPQAYLGNCLVGCITEANAGDLIGDDGVVVAAEVIGRAVEGVGEDPLKDAEGWLRDIPAFLANKPLSIAGSPKLRVYETDFGFGKPVKVEVVSIVHTGAVSLAESRDGRGGIEVGAALPKTEMDEFLSHYVRCMQ